MFFVIWGTKARQECPGTVADLCPYCCDVRPFDVIDTYRVPHIYYIGIGRGTFVARTRRCRGCSRHLGFDERVYAGPMSVSASRSASMQELLMATNPRLAHRIEELDRLRALATTSAYRDQGGDERFLECVTWARWLSSAALSDHTLHTLASWPSLDEDARARLVFDLRAAGAALRAALG